MGIAATVLLCGCGSASAAVAATGPFVYVANTKSDTVSQYSASASDFGALTPLAPATVPTGPFPYGIAIDPQVNSVYVANVGTTSAPAHYVSQYTINPVTGRLTPKSPATVSTGTGPVEIAVAPNGKSAYVVAGNGVYQYNVNPTSGALTPKSPATAATKGQNHEPIAITPNGKYAYLTDCPACGETTKRRHPHAGKDSGSAASTSAPQATVFAYRIDQRTGTLGTKPVSTVATGNGANGIAITPNGKSLYVAVSAVWQYTINPTTGQLAPKSPATVAAPGNAHEIAIAPDGKNAYVVTLGNNTVSQYRINPKTGALSSKPASTARTVVHPESIKIAPDGQTAYVTSENDGKLSQYTINPTTGKITPMSPPTVPTAGGAVGESLVITPER
jgi:6-phosphogluconolactonase (cycloisomerase 2 family)